MFYIIIDWAHTWRAYYMLSIEAELFKEHRDILTFIIAPHSTWFVNIIYLKLLKDKSISHFHLSNFKSPFMKQTFAGTVRSTQKIMVSKIR